ncbi:MAG: Coenzyme F420 hydrogenase/dehydrogenase, beta subunit C-terminal domain [Candidatus Baldrarchaeia archaeon]
MTSASTVFKSFQEAKFPLAFGILTKNVINANRCCLCGTCVASCPLQSISIINGTPKLIGTCYACGSCYSGCPQTIEALKNRNEMEVAIFGRTRSESEPSGIFRASYAAKTKIGGIRDKCQDGGVVTTLLFAALEEGLIDSAIVSTMSSKEPWKPEPKIATTLDEIINAAGTKYAASPNVSLLGQIHLGWGLNKIAFVGTPCQVYGVRRMQFFPGAAAKFVKKVKYIVGLFCMENYPYEKLFLEYIVEKKGLKLEEITKFDIKKGKFLAYKGKELVLEVPVSETKDYTLGSCHTCPDLTAEFADISVGSIGSPAGWSTVLVRTDKGEELLNAAIKKDYLEVKDLKDVKPGITLVYKLSKAKAKQLEKLSG